jgi:quercetin dioxygenase-like cupin family protein
MEKISLDVAFSDDRGRITDMLQNVEINAVTFITFRKDAVRGNHYHKATTQWNYVTSGKILLRTSIPGEGSRDTVMGKGDFVVTVPNERHALLALEDSELLVFTQGPRGGKEYESDTFRDETPLIPPAS